jgi:hypothetical protein
LFDRSIGDLLDDNLADLRTRALAIAAIVSVSTALGVAMLTGDHDWGDDFAAYIMQAASIVHGSEREEVARAAVSIHESSRYFGPVATPWGFPAMLAPAYAACGVNIWCLKLVNIPCFALFVVVFWVFLTARLPGFDAALIASVLAFSPVLLEFENNVLSDIAFLFFSTLAIVAIDLVVVRPRRIEGSPRGNVAVGAAMFLAFFVRANGALLIPALFITQGALYLELRRRGGPADRPRAAALAPYAVFALLALFAAIMFPGGGMSDAAHYLTLTLWRVRDNISAYAILASVFFWPIPFYELFYGALLPFLLCGLTWHAREDIHVVVYCGLTLLLFVLWPEQQGLRYIFPMLPFFVYFAYRGMKANAFALTDRHRTAGNRLTHAVWIGVALSFVVASVRLVGQKSRPTGGPFAAESLDMFDAVKAKTTRGDLVVFDKPRLMRLMTDRDAILVDRCDQLAKGRVVVVRKGGGDANQIASEKIATCDPSLVLTPIFDNAQFIVYRIARRNQQ